MTTTDYPSTTGTDLDAPPKLDRPAFHVWVGTDPDDAAPEYVGVVTITNADQLTAETQAKGLGLRDIKAAPMHYTNLWIWAAMVRRQLTADKFQVFTKRMEYRPVKEQEDSPGAEDPTDGGQGLSTD